MCLNKQPLTKPLVKHPLKGNWIRLGLDNAARERSLMRHGPKLVTDLVSLVNKYAKEACQCDIMYGFQCEIHNQVREDLKEVLDKYEYKVEA